MANTKITDLASISAVRTNDVFMVVDNTTAPATPATKKVSVGAVFGNVSTNTVFNANVVVSNNNNQRFGNSTFYNSINSTSMVIANNTMTSYFSTLGLVVNTNIAVNSAGIFAGSNTYMNTGVFYSGSSNLNLTANANQIKFANSSTSANLTINGLAVGISSVNSSSIYVGTNVYMNSSGLAVGNNTVYVRVSDDSINIGSLLYISNSTLSIGNATINSFTNSTFIRVGNTLTNSTINSIAISVGNTIGNITITIPTASQIANTNMFLHANSQYATPEEHLVVDVSRDETTVLANSSNKFVFRAPFKMDLTKPPRALVSTASTSGVVTIDININDVSMFSTLLTIDALEYSSKSAASTAVLSDNTLNDDDKISVDVDNAGTGTKGLKLIFYYKRS